MDVFRVVEGEVNLVDSVGAPLAVTTSSGSPVLKVDAGFQDIDVNVTTSSGNYVRVVETNVDAFQRAKVSEPFTLFDSKQIYNDQALFWDKYEVSGGSVAYDYNRSASVLSVTTVSGSRAIRQTKEYFNYQPGKSHMVMMTGSLGEPKQGVVQRVGYYDDENGLFFEQNDTGIYVVRRSNVSGYVVDTVVPQSQWSEDTLDGTGSSGVNIDLSKVQIFFIDFEWLGAGSVRMGFFLYGSVSYCHRYHNANYGTNVYMRTPNLPVRYELINTDTTASSTEMQQICCSVSSEGSYTPRYIEYAKSRGTDILQVDNGDRTAVMSIRLKAVDIRRMLSPRGYNIYVQQDSLVELVLNGTFTGTPSWSSVGTYSFAEYSDDDLLITGGVVINSRFVASEFSYVFPEESALRVVSNIAGESDILSLVVTPSVNNTDVTGELIWKEVL